jgi:hypothetical protein
MLLLLAVEVLEVLAPPLALPLLEVVAAEQLLLPGFLQQTTQLLVLVE